MLVFSFCVGSKGPINEKPRNRVRGVFSESLFPPIAEIIYSSVTLCLLAHEYYTRMGSAKCELYL